MTEAAITSQWINRALLDHVGKRLVAEMATFPYPKAQADAGVEACSFRN